MGWEGEGNLPKCQIWVALFPRRPQPTPNSISVLEAGAFRPPSSEDPGPGSQLGFQADGRVKWGAEPRGLVFVLERPSSGRSGPPRVPVGPQGGRR